MANKTILINDDETEICNLIADEFQKRNFDCIVTHSCEQALEEAEKKRPHLIITDIVFPGQKTTGKDLIAQIREKQLYIPVIAISGEVTLERTPYPFIQKPFSVSEVIDYVVRFLDEIRDNQLIQTCSENFKIDENQIGKIIAFYPSSGWGLIRTKAQDAPLYVNASDVMSEQDFRQLYFGQFVQFTLNKSHPKGPRAAEVKVIWDPDCPQGRNK